MVLCYIPLLSPFPFLLFSRLDPFVDIISFFGQDHAPGSLLVTEAGGAISDSRGELLDFGLGRDLGENFGVIAAGKSVHADILAAVKKAGDESKSKV